MYYKITVGDKFQIAAEGTEWDIADKMVSDAGGNVIPTMEKCDALGNTVSTTPPTPSTLPASILTANLVNNQLSDKTEPVYSNWGNTVVDDAAKKRIEETHQKLSDAGIKVDASQQFFATGTRMAREGYATQEARKKEHDAKKSLEEVIDELTTVVRSERRTDHDLSAKEIGNKIQVNNNTLLVNGHTLTENAIRGLILRLTSPSITYILGLQQRIREEMGTFEFDKDMLAKDVNKLADTVRHECLRYGDVACKLRVREEPRDVYAVLSPSYGIADAPMVVDQIKGQMPADAKGSFAYDQSSTYWMLEANIWTPTPVSEMSVGEAFQGGVKFSSADSGNGRFRGGGSVLLLRCLNASVYSAGESMSRVHKGKVMYDIAPMIRKSLKAVDALCNAWGVNRKEEIPNPDKLVMRTFLPALFRDMLKRGELTKVLAGRKETHVQELTHTYYAERRDSDKVVRSDLAQSWTRYIQKQPFDRQQEGERAIGEWLVNKKPIRPDLKED